MTELEELRVDSADRMQDSVIIGFSNGRCARYSTNLLYSMLPQAEELFEQEPAKNPSGTDESAA